MNKKAFTLQYNFISKEYEAFDKGDATFIMADADKQRLYDRLAAFNYTMQYMPRKD